MTKLTDTQAILLSNAAQREDGSVLPLTASLAAGPQIDKAIAALLRRELISVQQPLQTEHNEKADEPAPPAYVITSAGLAAIGLADDADAARDDQTTAPLPATSVPQGAPAPGTSSISAAPAMSKIGRVLGLLQRDEGASVRELIAATGWLPHTTRAALTGLRKKGHVIDRTGRGETTCYRVAR
jgi:hypothetical protein